MPLAAEVHVQLLMCSGLCATYWIKSLPMIIMTKAMGLFIGDGVKILICPANWFPIEAQPVVSFIVNGKSFLSDRMDAR